MNSQQSNDTYEDKSNGHVWINTGTWFLDQVLQSGIPQGKYNVIVGKSRQTGKSYYTHQMYMRHLMQYITAVRKDKIKRIIDLI